MNKIMQLLCIVTSLAPALYASREVACKCNNKTVQFPACGVCGSESGHMERTETGINCFCDNDLKFSANACDEVCANHGGWSGDFEDQ